jgi:SulP family sulfate permease
MRNVPAIDATGIRVLDDLHRDAARHGVAMLIAGLQPQPAAALERAGRLESYGRENLAVELDEALARAGKILASRAEGRS